MRNHADRPQPAGDGHPSGNGAPPGPAERQGKPIIATASFDEGHCFLGVIRTARGCLPCEARSFEELLAKLAACAEQNAEWLAGERYDPAEPRKVVFHDYLPDDVPSNARSVVVSGFLRDGQFSAEGDLDGAAIRVHGATFDDLVRHILDAARRAKPQGRPRIRLCVEAAF